MQIYQTFTSNLFNNTQNNSTLNAKSQLYFASNNLRNDSFEFRPTNLGIGSQISNFGEIINTPKIINIKTNLPEECLLLRQQDSNNGSYKLIKNNPKTIKELIDFLKTEPNICENYKKNSFSFSIQELQNLKKNNPKAFQTINDLIISEINYTTLSDPRALEKLSALGYEKIDKSKDIIGIQNFITYQKNYKDAYRYVAIPLLKKILNENPNIIIKANAFGENPASPVNLYLRYGFIPLSANLDEIKQHTIKTRKGNRIDPNYQVVMYLPKDAILHSIIKKSNI